jgi:hypothetical protein
MTHLVLSKGLISPDNLKKGFLYTLFSVMFIAMSLIWITVVDGQTLRVVFFVVFWALLFTYKLLSVKISRLDTEDDIDLEIEDDTNLEMVDNTNLDIIDNTSNNIEL